MARILWRDDKGQPVPLTEPPAKGYLVGFAGAAEAEHPPDKGTDANGWTEVSDTYQAPAKAHACHHRVALPLGAEGQGRMGRGFADRGAQARAANGPPRDHPLPALGQVAGSQLRGLRSA